MNDREWNELQQLWKSGPAQAAPVATELERLGRGRRWAAVGIAVEALMAVAGFALSVWMVTRGGAFLVVAGVTAGLFTAATCALSVWARTVPRPNLDDPIGRAVAVARRSVFVSVRVAAATIWALVVGQVFAAVMAFARALLTTEANLAGYVAIGGVQLMLATWLAFAFRHYQKRSADLAKLDAIAAQLQE